VKRVTDKIRSAGGPLIKDCEIGWEMGSRGAQNCFWGNIGICAELRREFNWGNLNLGVFWVYGRGPTWTH
jgi:hypothetical protein